MESQLDAATRIQPGFSGGPVIDADLGVVVGLLSEVPPAGATARDSYAISTDRMRLAWGQELGGHPGRGRKGHRGELTILHVSDTRLGRQDADGALFGRLHRDLGHLAESEALRPDLMVVTGDLAASGQRGDFTQVTRFLAGLADAAQIPRRHVAIVPGECDVSQRACEAYFLDQEDNDARPLPPYWPKWRHFAAAFGEFYADVPGVSFTPDAPWTLFEMPDLGIVVAGLNSTITESHREPDHYGWLGPRQLEWFAERLQGFKARGYLRLAALHHNVTSTGLPAKEPTGALLGRLIALPGGGHAILLADDRYRVDDPGDDIWWAIKLCRFAPGELDPYVAGLREIAEGEQIFPRVR